MKKPDYCYSKIYEEGAQKSAREVIPLVMELVHPERVVDVGCGLGSWLRVFKDLGIEDIWGIDGDWVNKELLQIPKDRFLLHDLKKPLDIEKRFDLVVSLEVGEHLPPESAGTYVDSLTMLGPVVLFSAAIPFQGGGPHLNEQWPDYWAKLFEKNGFVPVDCIRKKIWKNDKVEWWYAQNILIFVKGSELEKFTKLKKEFERTGRSQLSIVHPRKYLWMKEEMSNPKNLPLGRALRALPNLIEKAIKRNIRQFFK